MGAVSSGRLSPSRCGCRAQGEAGPSGLVPTGGKGKVHSPAGGPQARSQWRVHEVMERRPPVRDADPGEPPAAQAEPLSLRGPHFAG